MKNNNFLINILSFILLTLEIPSTSRFEKITKNKNSPFRMWGSYAGLIIILLIFGFTVIKIIIWMIIAFTAGWIIHLLIRKMIEKSVLKYK